MPRCALTIPQPRHNLDPTRRVWLIEIRVIANHKHLLRKYKVQRILVYSPPFSRCWVVLLFRTDTVLGRGQDCDPPVLAP